MVMMRYPMLSNSLLIFYALNHEYLGIVFYLMIYLSFKDVALSHKEAIIYCKYAATGQCESTLHTI